MTDAVTDVDSIQPYVDKTELDETIKVSMNELREEIFGVRKHVLNLIVNENTGLRSRIQTLESRLLSMEMRMNSLEQNQRKSNIEFDGIPAHIPQENLAATVTNIVNSIVEEDNKITSKDVEAVHRLHSKRSPFPTIVRLKRNVIDNIRRN